jgi:endonuclease/exonuclease/phosphatase family metal-dependent hydrolase
LKRNVYIGLLALFSVGLCVQCGTRLNVSDDGSREQDAGGSYMDGSQDGAGDTTDGSGRDDAGIDGGSVSDGGTGADADEDDGGDACFGCDGGGDGSPDSGADGGPADAGVSDGGDGGPDDAGAGGVFSVMTINMKHPLTGIDEAVERMKMIAAGINEKHPDVVMLQEVVKDGSSPSFAEQLAGLTGYQWYWEFCYTVPFLFDEGLGILSRWPIAWTGSAELPHLDLVLFRRHVLGGRVDSPKGGIQIYCTHLTTDSDETVKADQALAVYQFIQNHPSQLPGFLAGDMNAEPQTAAMRFFRGESEYGGVRADFIDSWMSANPGDEGFTMTSSNPTKRIDYIYVIPGQASSALPASCELMFTRPVGGVYPSDHRGIYCEYKLP